MMRPPELLSRLAIPIFGYAALDGLPYLYAHYTTMLGLLLSIKYKIAQMGDQMRLPAEINIFIYISSSGLCKDSRMT